MHSCSQESSTFSADAAKARGLGSLCLHTQAAPHREKPVKVVDLQSVSVASVWCCAFPIMFWYVLVVGVCFCFFMFTSL